MASYRIFRMKESVRNQFRWAPHTLGMATARQKDYEAPETVEGDGFYAIWMALRHSERPLEVGDIVENEHGELRICKYVGFERVQWWTPETSTVESSPAAPVIEQAVTPS